MLRTAIGKLNFLNFRPYATTSKDNISWFYAKLTHRSLLRVRGRDTLAFLQGIVTNDTRYLLKSMENYRPSLFSMILNTQGRILYDVILYSKNGAKEAESENVDVDVDVYIECDRSVLAEVTKQLVFYRLRRKLEFQSCDKELNIYALFSKVPVVTPSSSPPSRVDGLEEPFVFCPDPRVPQLGFRAIVNSEKDVKKIFLAEEATEDEYHALRYDLGVAEGCGDMPPGAAFPLEANGDYMNGISFHKGCYVGQELTARTHHTGVVRKRLMPLKFDVDASNIRINAKIMDEKGFALGKFRRAIQRYGLGLLYVREALAAKTIHIQRDEGDSIVCKTEKPIWWETGMKLDGEIRGFHTKRTDVQESQM